MGNAGKASAKKRTRGRPPLEPGRAKRSSFNTRIRPQLKEHLERDAKVNGRSLSEEIEFRLEAWILRDEADKRVREAVLEDIYDSFGGEKKFGVMRLKASMIQMVEQSTGKSYFEDPDTNIKANAMMAEADNRYGPAKTDEVPNILQAGVQKKAAREWLDIWHSGLPGASKKKRRTKKGAPFFSVSYGSIVITSCGYVIRMWITVLHFVAVRPSQ